MSSGDWRSEGPVRLPGWKAEVRAKAGRVGTGFCRCDGAGVSGYADTMAAAPTMVMRDAFPGIGGDLVGVAFKMANGIGSDLDAANSVAGVRDAASPEHHRQHQGTNEG